MHQKTVVALLVVLSAACGSPEAEAPALQAFGNEPFWNVTLSAADGIVYGRLGALEAARKKPWLFAGLILAGLIVLNVIFY